jgi:hypothetical protein
MKRKLFFGMTALTLGLALMFTIATQSTIPAAAGDGPKLLLGTIEGTVNLPSTLPQGLSSLPCSALKVGVYKYTNNGDPIGVLNGPSVTPQPAGAGKCSFKFTAPAVAWQLSIGENLPNWELVTHIQPSAGVVIPVNQTVTRTINITKVIPYKLN